MAWWEGGQERASCAALRYLSLFGGKQNKQQRHQHIMYIVMATAYKEKLSARGAAGGEKRMKKAYRRSIKRKASMATAAISSSWRGTPREKAAKKHQRRPASKMKRRRKSAKKRKQKRKGGARALMWGGRHITMVRLLESFALTKSSSGVKSEKQGRQNGISARALIGGYLINLIRQENNSSEKKAYGKGIDGERRGVAWQ